MRAFYGILGLDSVGRIAWANMHRRSGGAGGFGHYTRAVRHIDCIYRERKSELVGMILVDQITTSL